LNSDIESARTIRERQSSESYEKRLKKNEEIKQGRRKGKVKDADTVEAVDLDKTELEKTTLTVKQIRQKKQ